jgi:pectate lyase
MLTRGGVAVRVTSLCLLVGPGIICCSSRFDGNDAGQSAESPADEGAGAGGTDEAEAGPSVPSGELPAVEIDPSSPSVALQSELDSDGCPIHLEGFAAVTGMNQAGTFGGRDGEVVTVTTQDELTLYTRVTEPLTIRVQGTITLQPKGTEIQVFPNKTIVGVGADAAIVQGGFFVPPNAFNIIIRNLTIRDAFVEEDPNGDANDFDAIQMDSAHHVWIDHCHLQRMGDGLIDSRLDTTYLTVSWSILSDHNKTFGIGWTDNVTTQMTLHHNWIRDSNQRNPSVDNVLRAHLYDNFLQRIASYGNWARGGTNMVLQNTVFEEVTDPHYADTGTLYAAGNLYRRTSGRQETQGDAFFNPETFYEYTLDPAADVEELLASCAGPLETLGL